MASNLSFEKRSRLWFERLCSRLGLPFFLGVVLLGVVPVLGITLLAYAVGYTADFGGSLWIALPITVANALFLLYASRYIGGRVEVLREYCESMSSGGPVETHLHLKSVKGVLVAWILLLIAGAFFFEQLFTPQESFQAGLLRELLFGYQRLLQGTFLWVFGVAMYSIYQFGKLPLKLKHFTQDRTLGLKIFATASLHFITLYVIAVFLSFPLFLGLTYAGLISAAIFLFIALVLFLLPLLSLRAKLIAAKRSKIDWITQRHTRMIEQIEKAVESPIDGHLVSELLAIDKIQHDVRGIRHWPFDFGIIAQLTTIVATPLLITLLTTYLVHLLKI